MVVLTRIDETHGTAELGCWITPDAQGEAPPPRAACSTPPSRNGGWSVWADALATNDASNRMLAKLGFVEEGRERAAFVQDGERVDRVNYGLLADEFEG